MSGHFGLNAISLNKNTNLHLDISLAYTLRCPLTIILSFCDLFLVIILIISSFILSPLNPVTLSPSYLLLSYTILYTKTESSEKL